MKKKGINRREIRKWLARTVRRNVWRDADKEAWVEAVVVSILETGNYEVKGWKTASGHPETYY